MSITAWPASRTINGLVSNSAANSPPTHGE